MPEIAVIECETAADVLRLAKERAARRRMAEKTATVKRVLLAATKGSPEFTVAGAPLKTKDQMIGEIVRQIFRMKRGRLSPPIAVIQREVADAFGITVIDILSDRRDWQSTNPRQIAMLISRLLTGKSMPVIGQQFGGRDHTTVLHAIRKFDWMKDGLGHLSDLNSATEWAQCAFRLFQETNHA